jgi:hypothetical protein
VNGEPYAGPLPKPQSRAAEKQQQSRDEERHWQHVRRAVMTRDRYRCRSCGTAEQVDVHHIKFRSAGGGDSLDNCACLCRCCHAELHAYRLYAEGSDANGVLKFKRA